MNDDPKAYLLKFITKGTPVSIAISPSDEESKWINGTVQNIYTVEEYAKDGIKVRLEEDGTIGRVKKILESSQPNPDKILGMIKDINGESKILEFKETFNVKNDNGEKLKCLRYQCAKEIAAFMNTEGGYLIIGVNDSQEIVGLESDYKVLNITRKNQSAQDKLKQEIEEYINSKIKDSSLTKYYEITILELEGKEVCVIDVQKSTKPVFLDEDVQYKKCDSNNMVSTTRHNYYIRIGSSTKLEDPRKIQEYLSRGTRIPS